MPDGFGCVELLKTCNSTNPNCSREACKPSLEEVVQNGFSPAYPFIYVSNNTDCPGQDPSSNGTCHFMLFDFDKSFVRSPTTTDTGSIATAADMCAQRKLDEVFKNVSTPEDFTRLFFGSATGTWRVYPGLDEADCGGYETRFRNWYIASTSVPKAVMVLVDVGASMINKDKFGGDVFLETAKSATRELLRTLAPGDSVNIIAFNSINATQFLFPPVTAQERPNNSQNYPEYTELQAKLSELKTDQTHFEASNITTAIDKALENFDYIKRPDALKVIVVLTDGRFAEGSVILPTASLAAAKTKLFVYDVSPTAKNLTASFTTQLCKIGGSFINIYRDVKNPLYAMESFYSFTATLHHRLMNTLADFTYKLDEFSRFNETVLMASKPAFRADGSLIGVAGISIYRHMLKDNLDEIRTIVNQQQAGRKFDARTMVLGPANCTIQLEPKSVYVCGSNTILPPNRGFCKHMDGTSNIQDRSCLHQTCRPPQPQPPPDTDNKLISIFKIVGPIAAALLVIAGVCIAHFGTTFYKRWRQEMEAIDQNNLELINRPPPPEGSIVNNEQPNPEGSSNGASHNLNDKLK
ncbi:hypothetical protein M758_2G240200 [Ceratodon purpureus]|nr:hypothetical protein M758_2G240200 [Ceratodon purpureus]KAG0627961.1 hypothetical protein M758_2G240200 [Ceratodon purpureus]KAG0627962.1 hypothetical protein M758_2G240200 [Ceratodon purpureus]